MRIPVGSYWRLLGAYLARQRARVAALALLLAAGIALQLASPQVLRSFIDLAVSGGGAAGVMGRLVALAFVFMALALGQQLVTVASVYVSETVAWAATNTLRADLARHCADLDMSFHNEHRPGELIEQIDGDVASLANFFSQFVTGSLFYRAGPAALGETADCHAPRRARVTAWTGKAAEAPRGRAGFGRLPGCLLRSTGALALRCSRGCRPHFRGRRDAINPGRRDPDPEEVCPFSPDASGS